jgi:uncharacterized phage protein (TIGR02220 family)
MPIFRALKDGNFTQMTNKVIDRNNPNKLSPEAVGILFYMLSNKDDWQFYEQEIAEHFNCGITKIRSGIKELINNGYIVRKLKQGEHGRFTGYDYYIYEEPQPTSTEDKRDSTVFRISKNGKTVNGKTKNGKSNTNNTNNNNTNNNNNKNNNERKSPSNLNNPLCSNLTNTVTDIIGYLNNKAGRNFKASTKAYIREIEGRLKEGYTVENFKYVIDVKVAEWKDDANMQQHLNPVTLFKASNFDRYLNQPKPARQLSKIQKMEGIDYNELDRLHKIQETSKKTGIVY